MFLHLAHIHQAAAKIKGRQNPIYLLTAMQCIFRYKLG